MTTEFNRQHAAALRAALGLSVSQMADAVGLAGAPDNRADYWRQIENGARNISGPLARVLRYLSQGAAVHDDPTLSDGLAAVLPTHLECSGLEAPDDEPGRTIIMRTAWPRFFAVEFEPDELPPDAPAMLRANGSPCLALPAEIGSGWLVVLWIDTPASDPTMHVNRAAQLMIDRIRRDLAP